MTGGEKSLVCDPGSVMTRREREKKRAKIIMEWKKQTTWYSTILAW